MDVVATDEFLTYSLAEVHEMTNIPLRSLYEQVRAGSLRIVTPYGAKRGWRVTRRELVRYLGLDGGDGDAE
jgi:hypothetical protein